MVEATVEAETARPTAVDVSTSVASAASALAAAGFALYSLNRVGLGRPMALGVASALALTCGASSVVLFRRIGDQRARVWTGRAVSVPLGYVAGWYLIVPGFTAGSLTLIWAGFAIEAAICAAAFLISSLRWLRTGAVASVVGGLLAAVLFSVLVADGLW